MPETVDDIIKKISKTNVKGPLWTNKLVYDSSAETLEPVYFWILDLIQSMGWNVEKIADNFVASPGSGYFAEIGARATKMQEEGMKILGVVNQVVKSIINLIYDLKEFEIRMSHYENTKSKDKREEGMLALKQIWMDNVDIKRGRGSINQMSYELGFVTLRDAFMSANSVENVKGLDINERVKRVLEPRIAEFLEWAKRSEAELKKRYEIELSYLKSQVDTLKLYTRWVKPYIKAAEELQMKEVKDERKPWIVSAFNTMVLELSLFNRKKVDVKDAAYNNALPESFARLAEKKKLREMYSIIVLDFAFRGIPRRVPETHYVHGGRVEVYFRAYSLNEDELKVLKKKLSDSDIYAVLGLAQNLTDDSLKQLIDDIEYFTKKEERKKEESEKLKKEREANPFSSLFLGFKEIFSFKKAAKKEEKSKEEEEKEKAKLKEMIESGVKADSYEESLVRKLAERDAMETSFKVFEAYKKAHGMAAFPVSPFY